MLVALVVAAVCCAAAAIALGVFLVLRLRSRALAADAEKVLGVCGGDMPADAAFRDEWEQNAAAAAADAALPDAQNVAVVVDWDSVVRTSPDSCAPEDALERLCGGTPSLCSASPDGNRTDMQMQVIHSTVQRLETAQLDTAQLESLHSLTQAIRFSPAPSAAFLRSITPQLQSRAASTGSCSPVGPTPTAASPLNGGSGSTKSRRSGGDSGDRVRSGSRLRADDGSAPRRTPGRDRVPSV
jgi:hypothetical protein